MRKIIKFLALLTLCIISVNSVAGYKPPQPLTVSYNESFKDVLVTVNQSWLGGDDFIEVFPSDTTRSSVLLYFTNYTTSHFNLNNTFNAAVNVSGGWRWTTNITTLGDTGFLSRSTNMSGQNVSADNYFGSGKYLSDIGGVRIPYWINLNGNITSNLTINDGHVHVSGRLSQNTSKAEGEYAVALGRRNYAGGISSVVSGGDANSAHSNYAVIGGGHQNYVYGMGATVGGGLNNGAMDNYDTVSGGWYNTAEGWGSSVVGGVFVTSGNLSTVAGGWFTKALNHSAVAFGNQTVAGGRNSVVSGGYDNVANGDSSAVGGGRSNTVLQSDSIISGGAENVVDTMQGTIAGGYQNTIASDTSGGVISGGYSNYVTSGTLPTVGGGQYNTAAASEATVSGGGYNTASGQYSAIMGGYKNTASGKVSFAAGDEVVASATNATAFGAEYENDVVNSFQVGWGEATLNVTKSNAQIRGDIVVDAKEDREIVFDGSTLQGKIWWDDSLNMTKIGTSQDNDIIEIQSSRKNIPYVLFETPADAYEAVKILNVHDGSQGTIGLEAINIQTSYAGNSLSNALYANNQITPGEGVTMAGGYGLSGRAISLGDGVVNSLTGLKFSAQNWNNGGGRVYETVGIEVDSGVYSNVASNVTYAYGAKLGLGTGSLGGITGAGYHIYLEAPKTTYGGPIDDYYGIWMEDFSGADGNNMGLVIDSDTLGINLGDGQDASITYDGSNMVINPQEVGDGILRVEASLNATGDVNATGTICDGDGNCLDGFGSAGVPFWIDEAGSIMSNESVNGGRVNITQNLFVEGVRASGNYQSEYELGQTTVTADGTYGDNTVTVDSTEGFLADGWFAIYNMCAKYSSIDATHFYGVEWDGTICDNRPGQAIGPTAGGVWDDLSQANQFLLYKTSGGAGAIYAPMFYIYKDASNFIKATPHPGKVTFQNGVIYIGGMRGSSDSDLGISGYSLGDVRITADKGVVALGGNRNVDPTAPDGGVELRNDTYVYSDDRKLYFGAAADASITYDGSHLQINPHEQGSGGTQITGDIGVGVAPDSSFPIYVRKDQGAGTQVLISNEDNTGYSGFGVGDAAGRRAYFSVYNSAYATSAWRDTARFTADSALDAIVFQTWGDLEFLTRESGGEVDTVYFKDWGTNQPYAEIDNRGNAEFDGNLTLNFDNHRLYLGSSQDASITYDGDHLIINPDEVGSGQAFVDGDLNVTGNIAGGDGGKIYFNNTQLWWANATAMKKIS